MAGNVSHGETHDLVPSPNDLPVHPILVSHATRQQAPKNALVLTHLGGFHSWTLGLRLSWGSPLGPDRVSPILSCHFMFSPTLVPLSSSGLEEMGL